MTEEARLLDTVWVMITASHWYPVQPSSKCKPEDHAALNPHVVRIEDSSGKVLWSRTEDTDMKKITMKDLNERLEKVESRQAAILDALNDVGTHSYRAAVAFSKQDTTLAYLEIDLVHSTIDDLIKQCHEIQTTVNFE